MGQGKGTQWHPNDSFPPPSVPPFRATATSLPQSSFEVPEPRPVSVTFPSSPALETLMGPESYVQVRVASFALNPFRQLNGKPIRSVASVALAAEENETAEEQALHVQGLTEEIEIVLGGEADGGEASAMSSSMAGLGAGLFSLEVNITSLEDALLVSVRPQVPLQITLNLLGPPGSKGNGSGSLLNTTFPEGQPEEETASVWVIPPESLRCGLGTYFISGEVTPVANASWNLSVGILSSGCYYWNSQDQAWKTDGCRVGPQSSLLRTQCLCNHLSFFGRFSLVLPHVIDLRRTGLLLSRVGQNPAGVALLSSLLLGYLAALIWARWRQRADARTVRPEGQAPRPRGEGPGPKASRGLERGGMDAFLLATRRPLGNLHAARLWHNQTGSSPSWFVRHLVVRDLNVRRRWYFLCNCWLASDMDDGQVDKVFVAASQEELLSRRHLFWAGLVGKLTQEHLWLSVLTCSVWSPFTRVQRLSCCLALLLCSMLINIMFWKEAPRDDEPSSEAEPFVVTWKELMVSAQVAVLMVPVNLMVVHVFKLVHSPLGPQHPPSTRPPCPPLPASPVDPLTHLQQELIETLGFLLKNILWQHREAGGFPGALQQVPELVASLCALVRSHLQALEDPGAFALLLIPERSRSLHSYICLVVKDLEAQLRNLDWCSLPKPYDYLHAADQLHKLWKNLEQHLPPFVEVPLAPPPSLTFPDYSRWRLPSRWGFLCWGLVGTLSLASAFFTVLYSLQMSRERASRWALSVLLSVLQNVLLMQPLKVLVLTALFSLMRKKQLWEDEGQERRLHQALGALLAERQHYPPTFQHYTGPLPRPPALKSTARATDRTLREKKLYSWLWEIVGQLVFLAVLMTLSYIERSPEDFYLNAALQRRLTTGLAEVQTTTQFYFWASKTLVPAIYEDDESQGAGGDPATGSTLREYPVWGRFALYPGSGYVAHLGTNASHAQSGISPSLHPQSLSTNSSPRTIHQDAGVPSSAPLSTAGALQSKAELRLLRLLASGRTLLHLALARAAFLVLLVGQAFVQGRRMIWQKWGYFGNKRNLLDTSALLVGLVAFGLQFKRAFLAYQILTQYRQNRRRFISLYEMAEVDAAITYLIAFLLALATVKLWNLLRLNARMQIITQTLQAAWEDLLGFLLVLLVLLAGYSMACNLLFGWSILDYRTVLDSAVTIVGLLMGIFDYQEVVALDPVLGSLLVISSIFSMVFVTINLLVSVLLIVFGRKMKAAKASKEESMLQLIQLKISLLFGIKQQMLPSAPKETQD
uniref:Polycystin 1 like 3, transient receptor potential channel interacting n=1 Tax=Anolis carolinensis TaxID=28377 RepID=H9GDF0_ANOCA